MVWQMRYKDSGVWSSFYDIPSPNDDITIQYSSNMQKRQTYDGSLVRLTPTTKYTYREVGISWSFISAATVLITSGVGEENLKNISENGYPIQFKTHSLDANTGIEYWYGYIQENLRMYKLGMYPNVNGTYETFYDLSLTFDLITITSTAGSP
jgi:hypothetical protein